MKKSQISLISKSAKNISLIINLVRLRFNGYNFFPLTQRGFFSEINIYISILLLKGLKVRLLISDSSLLQFSFADKYINKSYIVESPNFFCKAIYDSRKISLAKNIFWYSIVLLRSAPFFLFREVWLKNVSDSNNKFPLKKSSEIIKKILVVDGSFADAFNFLKLNNIKNNSFNLIHIRAGDKLISEAVKVDYSKYLEIIPFSQRALPVIVMTDDYGAYEELVLCALKINFQIRIITTCRKNKSGYDQDVFLKLNNDQRLEEINSLIFEFSLACIAENFIGTFSSNIGRAIYIYREGKNCFGVDGDFKWIWDH